MRFYVYCKEHKFVAGQGLLLVDHNGAEDDGNSECVCNKLAAVPLTSANLKYRHKGSRDLFVTLKPHEKIVCKSSDSFKISDKGVFFPSKDKRARLKE